MVNSTLSDARAELLRLERMVAHQRSVVAALEALDGPPSLTTACTLEPLGTGPLTPDYFEPIGDMLKRGLITPDEARLAFATATPECILADIQTFWDWCTKDGNQPPLPNPGLLT